MRFNARRARDLSVYSAAAKPPAHLMMGPDGRDYVIAVIYDWENPLGLSLPDTAAEAERQRNSGTCYLLTTEADFVLHTNPWDTTPRTYFAIPVEALPDITIEGVENGTNGSGE